MTAFQPLEKHGGRVSNPWKPYPAYKPSGAGWFGDVPQHWEVRTLGSLGRFAASGIDKKTVEGEPLVHMVNYLDVYQNTTHELTVEREYMEVSCPDWKRRAYAVKRGDMFFTPSSETEDDIGWSAVAIEDIPNTVFSYHILRFRPECALDLRFQKYWCNNHAVLQRFSWACQGTTRQILTRSDFRSTPVVFPPVAEQRAIADFLDRETGKIDRLVAKKRELIEKLKEERSALISRAVTRGLNPDAKLKPSGLEWLSDVPEHWEVIPLRRRARRIQTGGTPPTVEERYYEDGTIPWFGPGSFDDQIVLTRPVKLLNSCVVTEGAARMFRQGSTMIVTIGATLGKVSSIATPGSCNQQITVVEYDERRVFPRFVTYQVKRLERTLRAIAPSATLPILDQGEIADIVLGLPPLDEQRAIADFLDRETCKIDRLAAKVEEAIGRLQEYRAALITAAVTGKIDVRGAAA